MQDITYKENRAEEDTSVPKSEFLPIHEIRRRNLENIRDTMFDGNQRKLSDTLGKQPSILTRTLNPDASGARGIGNNFAREIESKLGLEAHWLDQDHSSDGAELSLVANNASPLNSGLDPDIVMWVFRTMDELLGKKVRKREGEKWWSLTFIYLYEMASSDRQVMNLSKTTLLRMVSK